MIEYPEHDKMRAVLPQSRACGEFVDEFLTGKGIYLRTSNNQVISPGRLQELLAEFFEIDLDKIEAEKRAMLEELLRRG